MRKLGVIALSTPHHGGTYQYTQSMLQGLRYCQGYDITLYADPGNDDYVASGFPIRAFAATKPRQIAEVTADAFKIRLSEPFPGEDILLAPIYTPALLRTAKPFAFTLHDLQELYYPGNFSWGQRLWRRRTNKRLAEKATQILCESSHVRMDVISAFAIRQEKITVIAAPPLRRTGALVDAAGLELVCDRYQLPNRFLLYPAQFWPHKNHLKLIEAFRQISDIYPELGLVLTGQERNDFPVVMAAIEKAGLSGRVRHIGHVGQDDLGSIYRLAAMLVMPSLFESISIPIYEAFQAGTPVAAAGILAIPEQAGDAAVLFDPHLPASIAGAIRRILDDSSFARSLVLKGRERIAAMTPETYGQKLQAMLDRL